MECFVAVHTHAVQKSKIANALSKCSCKVVNIERISLKQLVILFGVVFESYDLRDDNKIEMNE